MGQVHNLGAETRVAGIDKAFAPWKFNSVCKALRRVLHGIGDHIKFFISLFVRLLDLEFLKLHDLGGDDQPFPVSVLDPFEEISESLGSCDHKWLSIFQTWRIAGGEEEMNEVGRMVRMEVGEENMTDFIMIDPNTGKLAQSPGSHIKKHNAPVQK